MNRRKFLTALAGLPLVGRLVKVEPKVADSLNAIRPTVYFKTYAHSIRLTTSETPEYAKQWVTQNLDDAIKRALQDDPFGFSEPYVNAEYSDDLEKFNG